jgi:hypothetical protein
MALYCFAASVPFKVGSASIAAEAFCIAISIESASGGFGMKEAVCSGKNLRIAGFYVLVALPNKRSEIG